MTDDVFEARENILLARRATKVREKLIRSLEFQALVEEVIEAAGAEETYPAPRMGRDAFTVIQGGKR